MALRQEWKPWCFRKNVKEGGHRDYDKDGFPDVVDGLLGDKPITREWRFGTFAKQCNVGATAENGEGGCAREAMRFAMKAHPNCDNVAVARLDTWGDWIPWKDLPVMFERLSEFSVLLYRHLLVGLRGQKRFLLDTPLGRQRLFAAGFRSIVLRPVTRDGWSRHVFAMSASERGD